MNDASPETPPRVPLEAFGRNELRTMPEAGEDAPERRRVLERTNDNVVGEPPRDAGALHRRRRHPEGAVREGEGPEVASRSAVSVEDRVAWSRAPRA